LSVGLSATGCTATSRKALVTRRPPEGSFIIRGAAVHGIILAWTAAPSDDNAMVEISFKPIKSELVWHKVFYTGAQGEQTIARHIDGFYNLVRRQSALNYTSPVQFEPTASR
jgi:putative transposase